MPRVYDQQIAWQPTGTQKMQYARLQDFIAPALERAQQSAENATEALRQIGDKQAASSLEQAARDAAYDIDNWKDWSEPEKTQDKMMATAMEKYDKAMANLDPATRNRINLYNPKSREIFELKSKEKATDAVFDYSYKNAAANMDYDIGRIITESNPENPATVKAAMDAHIEKMKKTLRPADALVYEKAARPAQEKGLTDWYIAHGQLDRAINAVQSDAVTGHADEVWRASTLKALMKMKEEKNKADKDGTNLVDILVKNQQDPALAYSTYSELTASIQKGYAPNKELVAAYGNLPLAGGYSYNQLKDMDYTKAVGIIEKANKALGDSSAIQEEARYNAIPIVTEFARVAEQDSDTNLWKLKDGADITSLRSMYLDAEKHGYIQALKTTGGNDDLVPMLERVGDIVRRERSSRALAFDKVGQNVSAFINNPNLESVFTLSSPAMLQTPATPEQAATFNTPEKQQEVALGQQAQAVAGGYKILHDLFNKKNYSPISADQELDMAAEQIQNAKPESLSKQQQILNTGAAMSSKIGGKKSGNYTGSPLFKDDWAYGGDVASAVVDKTHKGETTTKYEQMQSDLQLMAMRGDITPQQQRELSKRLYDLSEGTATVAYPCPLEGVSTKTWSRCMSAYGFGSVDNTARYNAALDRGMHEMSAGLSPQGRRYDAGSVGDTYEVLLARIKAGVDVGMGDYFGIKYPGVINGDFLAQTLQTLESKYDGNLDEIVDLTNNRDLYGTRGGEYERMSWDPAAPSPQTATDITKSKQYELIGDIERVFSEKLGQQIKFDEGMKQKLAMEIRQISSGRRREVETDISEKDRKELTNPRINEIRKTLVGE